MAIDALERIEGKTAAAAGVVKRSLVIAGHRTSISLETLFGANLRFWPKNARNPSMRWSPKSTSIAEGPICPRRSASICWKAPFSRVRWRSDRIAALRSAAAALAAGSAADSSKTVGDRRESVSRQAAKAQAGAPPLCVFPHRP